ncbi:MAG TPA: sulfate ABC transporter substrate-binding protein [Tepidisphaeraceae bacterium]|jgi:sulfate transport system substrate-binding protein
MNRFRHIALAAAAFATLTSGVFAQNKLLNVSYDPTRELYEEINQAFIADYAAKNPGKKIDIEQSHGGSGKQARAVVDGLKADVVTLALSADIDTIQKDGLIGEGWQSKLPQNSSPYVSTIVFLVRTGNPKGIKDWGDLIKPDVKVITPNPKTSGGARWNFLAAWGWAAGLTGEGKANDVTANAKAKEYIGKLFKNVPVLDTGARGSTITFAQKGVGDVLLAWENEAYLAQDETPGKFDIVYPSVSILAEPPVAIVDKNVDAHGTRALAEAYLKFLYTPKGQDIIAENHYRPRDTAVLAKHAAKLPPIKLFTIDEAFGGWTKTQKAFFADGGVFDEIYKK